MSDPVLQPWVAAIPWKQQSILFSGLRGPDAAHCPRIKEVSRWMRRVSQHDADPSKKNYMAPSTQPKPEELEKELEYSTCHFVHHFASALRVIALHHPEREVRAYAFSLHCFIASDLFHFVPVADAEFLQRHSDRRGP